MKCAVDIQNYCNHQIELPEATCTKTRGEKGTSTEKGKAHLLLIIKTYGSQDISVFFHCSCSSPFVTSGLKGPFMGHFPNFPNLVHIAPRFLPAICRLETASSENILIQNLTSVRPQGHVGDFALIPTGLFLTTGKPRYSNNLLSQLFDVETKPCQVSVWAECDTVTAEATWVVTGLNSELIEEIFFPERDTVLYTGRSSKCGPCKSRTSVKASEWNLYIFPDKTSVNQPIRTIIGREGYKIIAPCKISGTVGNSCDSPVQESLLARPFSISWSHYYWKILTGGF